MTHSNIRLNRFLDPNTQRTVIIPMDHGISEGAIEGLVHFSQTIQKIVNGGANAIVGHIGMAKQLPKVQMKQTSFLMHLSGSTKLNPIDTNDKVMVNSVENAIRNGADGISVHVNVGSDTESDQLRDFGVVIEECQKYNMPLLAMMYPRGEGLTADPMSEEMVSFAVRLGSEMGADIVKSYYTGTPDSFARVVESSLVPVVIAGGSKGSDKEMLEKVHGVIQAGGAGVSLGRNAFAHDHPEKFVAAIVEIVHGNASVESAYKTLTSTTSL